MVMWSWPLIVYNVVYNVAIIPPTSPPPQGHVVMWGWLQEKRTKVAAYTYAGALTLPRLCYLDYTDVLPGQPPHFHQQPPSELVKLRNPEVYWTCDSQL